MSERIIIDFDDEKEPEPDKKQDRIVIDFGEEEKKTDVPAIEESEEEKILKSKLNSFFKGSEGLNNYFESGLKFPEGIEQGFRRVFSRKLREEFFNSVLDNNKHVILASRSGNVYLLDRFSGEAKDKIFFDNKSFEKTGLVHENRIYVNSLNRIHSIDDSNDKIQYNTIYETANSHFIWSNLNFYKNSIVFLEFNPGTKNAKLKLIEIGGDRLSEFDFEVKHFLSDKICIAENFAYVVTDHSLVVFDLEKAEGKIERINVKVDENSFLFYLNHRVYITTIFNELYYLDLPAVNYFFKNTGIKNNYINSIGGFDDNLFAGTIDGWRYYKSSGLLVYNFEDEHENKIECMNRNVLAVSQKNKIVFCNLNRFQEAEGYVIASENKNIPVEIVAVIFSKDTVYVLTRNGTIEAFATDKLNIHL